MKKPLICLITIISIVALIIIINNQNFIKNISNGAVSIIDESQLDSNTNQAPDDAKNEEYVNDYKIVKLYVDGHNLDIRLEKNSATEELIKRLQDGPIEFSLSDYGGFEKVGSPGFSLPREDISQTMNTGDIALYSGNQIVIFYGSNTYSYTKLGRIVNVDADKLRDIFGSGNIIVKLEE